MIQDLVAGLLLGSSIMAMVPILAAQQVASAAGLQLPFEDHGACPFEGCTYREWTANTPVEIRLDRRDNAPTAFRLKEGDRIQALTGVVITLRPGELTFRAPQVLETPDGPIRVSPGDTVYLLTYQGEGFTKAWFSGRLYRDVDTALFFNRVCDTEPDRCSGKVVVERQTKWWVQVRNADGLIGWTDEPDKFDGKDALGR